MLNRIIYRFPNSHPEFFNDLKNLLVETPNCIVSAESIDLKASWPLDTKPITIFEQSFVKYPMVILDNIDGLDVKIDSLSLCGKNPNTQNVTYNNDESNVTKVTLNDNLGMYIELDSAGNKSYLLPIGEIYKRLKGHIVRIDHTGLNIPSTKMSTTVWSSLVEKLGEASCMYKYPTGEDWPFILPATENEFETDITEFKMGREPKFELVYDYNSLVSTIQIDLETDLKRSEIEKLFPEPYGVSFPDLAEYFRTVYIYHPWRDLSLRVDIRFKNTEIAGKWETGKWLVDEGGRIYSR